VIYDILRAITGITAIRAAPQGPPR
jgi:hypothetical protein